MKKSWVVSTCITIVLITTFMLSTYKYIADEVRLGLDLQGGFEILYEVEDPFEGRSIEEEKLVKQTASIIRDRVNLLGISEPVIKIEDEDRIRVQLAGVDDQEEARDILSIGGNITFRDTENNLVLSSKDFSSVEVEEVSDDYPPQVTVGLRDSVDMKSITEKYQGEMLVLWLDYVKGDSYSESHSNVIFSGHVGQTWSSKGIAISSDFTQEEADKLAKVLSTGDLPAPIEEVYSRSVSGQLGEKALHNTLISSGLAIMLIFLFMIWKYRYLGAISVFCMVCYLYLTFAIFVFLEGVLTLTGLAAFILGLGMAVDASIITFERLKEIKRNDVTFEQLVMEASNRSFITISDAQLTTLIAAAGLFVFGVGSVKGFAVMLIISIIAGFITCYALLRLLLYMVGETRIVEWYERKG
ncbi:SecD/SecF family protein translocase subunit [Guptibacillus algicola]|uniref:SecD/SecF family protein translocase subunit n=1 Tax=Guptibacillus algicola TaxID=225844 RepID=UPI001CD2A573|nr:SecD/SecF family protein translocase subunit [Alkalihalobacillus algicola]MCA0987496.1 SecD/SecF family protein translocase subunit [Alkalihalobacillus algicola]